MGGWGLKNIFLFSKYLATKGTWNFIQDKVLWCHLVEKKYIHPNSIKEYIRRPRKIIQNVPIFGKLIPWLYTNWKLVGVGCWE